jgi:hypothetical protein
MSIRATVLDAGGNWVGYTDPTTGELTNYGLPLHWWDGSAWQKVARTADGDPINGYDHVFVWTGVTWVPWSSQRYATIGTVVQGINPNPDGSPPITMELGYEVGNPIVFTAAYGSGNAPAPNDVVLPTGQFYTSPSFPTAFGQMGNGGGSTGFECEPGWDTFATNVTDPSRFWTTLQTSDDPTVPTTTWRYGINPDDASEDSAYMLAPVGVVGVSRIYAYATTNCHDPDDQNHRYFPRLATTAPADGLLLRAIVVWDQTAVGTGIPDPIATPDGMTEVWQGGQLTGSGYINGVLGMRMAIFSQSIPAGAEVDMLEVELSGNKNGETVSYSILLI